MVTYRGIGDHVPGGSGDHLHWIAHISRQNRGGAARAAARRPSAAQTLTVPVAEGDRVLPPGLPLLVVFVVLAFIFGATTMGSSA